MISGQQVHPRTGLIVALVMLGVAISVLVTAQGYSGGSGLFPRFIGSIFVALTAAEVVFRLREHLRGGGQPGHAPDDRAVVIKELRGFAWLGGFLAALYLTGFLVGIPAYIFAFLRLSGNRSLRQCLIMAAAATFFVYVLFIRLLQYRLYTGVLF